MAVCQPDVSKCAQLTGLPMFNVGFILFRRSPGVLALLEAWENLTRENFELGNEDVPPKTAITAHIDDLEVRRELLFMDQTSFVQLLSPQVNQFDLRLEIVDESLELPQHRPRPHLRPAGEDQPPPGAARPARRGHHRAGRPVPAGGQPGPGAGPAAMPARRTRAARTTRPARPTCRGSSTRSRGQSSSGRRASAAKSKAAIGRLRRRQGDALGPAPVEPHARAARTRTSA